MNTELGVATLAYGFTAGVMVALGLVFLITALRRGRFDAMHITFCCAGLTQGLVVVVTVRLQSSETISEYGTYLKVFGLVSLLALITITSLVAVWTESVPRALLIVHAVASILIGVLVVALPGGLLAGEITGLRVVSLFGESFVVHEATSSPWRPALDAYLLLSIVLIVVGLVRGRRRARAEVRVLSIGLAVLTAVGLYDSLVDEGAVSTPYLYPFGSLALVFVGSWWLATRAAENERQLEHYAVGLESTVVERTAELVDTNARLEREIARQAEMMEQLASLSEHFERVNAFVLDMTGGDEPTSFIELALGDLAHLVGARQVTLELDPHGHSTMGAVIRWPPADAPDAATGSGGVVVEQLATSGRRLGKLVVHSPDSHLDPQHERFVELASDHLAGFLERVELAGQIARTAAATERERLARELHDSVTQKLYAATFLSEGLLPQLADDQGGAAATVRRLRQVLVSSLAELRALMYEIHPPALTSTELDELLEQLGRGYGVVPDLAVEVTTAGVRPLPNDAKVALYRIAQEAVSNAVRHAEASVISVRLTDGANGVGLAVTDDGCGFDSTGRRSGRGLHHMRKRAAAIGASFEVDSSAEQGTTVRVGWLPPSSGLPEVSAGVDRAGSTVA